MLVYWTHVEESESFMGVSTDAYPPPCPMPEGIREGFLEMLNLKQKSSKQMWNDESAVHRVARDVSSCRIEANLRTRQQPQG